jgi:hypothetical protein
LLCTTSTPARLETRNFCNFQRRIAFLNFHSTQFIFPQTIGAITTHSAIFSSVSRKNNFPTTSAELNGIGNLLKRLRNINRPTPEEERGESSSRFSRSEEIVQFIISVNKGLVESLGSRPVSIFLIN